MRKVLTVMVFAALLCGMCLSGCSCTPDGKIDWKALGSGALNMALTSIIIPAYEKYHGDKETVVSWVMDKIKANEKYAVYVENYPVEELVGKLYDVVDKQWYSLLHAKGADTDAADSAIPNSYEFGITCLDFPDVLDVKVEIK